MAAPRDAQLVNADRWATVGRLAVGFVHDIGTPLSVIIGRAAMIREATPELERSSEESSARIVDNAKRISAMAERFIAFARPTGTGIVLAPLLSIARSAVELIEPWAKKSRVHASIEEAGDDVSANVDASEIQQAVANLVMNAVEAMPEGGQLSVAVRSTGREAMIVVADGGPGVPESDRERVFDSFYTTKANSAGIGLTVAKGIVESHQGRIVLGSSESGGASFTIILPSGET